MSRFNVRGGHERNVGLFGIHTPHLVPVNIQNCIGDFYTKGPHFYKIDNVLGPEATLPDSSRPSCLRFMSLDIICVGNCLCVEVLALTKSICFLKALSFGFFGGSVSAVGLRFLQILTQSP